MSGCTSAAAFKNPATRQVVWHLIDAADQRVGILASHIARLLLGKHKPIYNPSVDCGDAVVVINADKVEFSGRKWDQKLYRHHTGYPGGLREVVAKDLHAKFPERILQKAIFNMLPRNRMKSTRLKKLVVVTGDENPYPAQTQAPISHQWNQKLLDRKQFKLERSGYFDLEKRFEGGSRIILRDTPSSIDAWTEEIPDKKVQARKSKKNAKKAARNDMKKGKTPFKLVPGITDEALSEMVRGGLERAPDDNVFQKVEDL